jgi:hypothetical protein
LTSALLALSASVVAAVFAGSLALRFMRKRGPHNLFWSIALGMFFVASLSLAYGLGIGWSGPAFGAYYLFGAVLNVPFLGLGQVYLLWPERIAYATAVAVIAFSMAATITLLATPMTVVPSGKGHIPSGRDVYATSIPQEQLPAFCSDPASAGTAECRRDADPLAIWPRIFAVIGNVLGTLLVIAGTSTSALRLLKKRNRGRVGTRIALGNLVIAAGVIVVASGGTGARFGTTAVLPFTLAAGVSIMYAGFLLSTPKAAEMPSSDLEDREN